MHDGPTRQARRHARARDDVPRGRRPRRLERRQRAGDVVLHDQRRGRVADRAPARARGARAVHARSRRAGRTAPRTTGCRSPTRSSARSTTGASRSRRSSGRTSSAGTASTPTRRARRCFLPVVDNTRQYINVLLILLSEPHGKVPLFIDDWQPFRPVERDGVGGVGGGEARARRPDPLPADRRPQARARRLRLARRAGAAGLDHRPCAPTTRRTSCSRT